MVIFNSLLFFSILIYSSLYSKSANLMAFSLVGASFLVSIWMGACNISWGLYATFLMFLGGVLVVVLYMTSLSSNIKMELTAHWSTWPLLSLSAAGGLTMSGGHTLSQTQTLMAPLSIVEGGLFMMYLYTMAFLLLVLSISVKMVKIEKGSMAKRG